ncbi:MAG: type II toxin-antitoxin system VapB family antitoxin [Lentisphaeraceae bacterium]|nr:type II toxin-antitoxin system VapB family antitoxin [Lentisphaeraceae bacterium]
MATNLAIDNQLLEQALELGNFKTKKETVNSALKEFVEKRKQLEVINLFGTINFDESYDYKKARNR